MKTLIVPVLLSSRKIAVGSPPVGILIFKKNRSCKRFGGPVKLGFSAWLLVISSPGPVKFQKFSRCLRLAITDLAGQENDQLVKQWFNGLRLPQSNSIEIFSQGTPQPSLSYVLSSSMTELCWDLHDLVPRYIPTKFDQNPRRIAFMRAVMGLCDLCPQTDRQLDNLIQVYPPSNFVE